MLPNFVIIGAMKAGTTSLFRYLASHPEIATSEVKELDYFNRNWQLGLPWYESHFSDTGESKAVGEASPNYTKAHLWPATAQRMASVLPEARLIYVLRDPIERMRSMYHHQVLAGAEDRPIEIALRDESDPRTRDYIETSRYAFQLEKYLEHYDRRQILLITSESLREHRLPTVRSVFRFLQVNDRWIPPNLDRQEHRSSQKSFFPPTVRRIRRLPGYRALVRHTPGDLKLAAHRLITNPIDTQLSEELDAHLRERLFPDVEHLIQTVDRFIFGGWDMLRHGQDPSL